MSANTPLVSVVTVTYNHEAYIAQAIESVLSQSIVGEIEFLIGEDFSSDKTGEVCKSFAQKFPSTIRLFSRTSRNVHYIKGRATGRNNFVDLLKNCKGKYIALLDGDDYWTDAKKLEQQVKVLEENPGCVACYHSTKMVNENGHTLSDVYVEAKDLLSEMDFINSGSKLHTSSVLFRSQGLFELLLKDYMQAFAGDRWLYLSLAKEGSFFPIAKTMSAYRSHGGGVYSDEKKGEKFVRLVNDYSLLLSDAYYKKHKPAIKVKLAEYAASAALFCFYSSDFTSYLRYWLLFLRHMQFNGYFFKVLFRYIVFPSKSILKM